MKKFVIAIIIIATLIVNVNTCNVYAVGSGTGVASGMLALKAALDTYVDIASPTAQQTIQLMSEMLNSGGFINNLANYSNIGSIINYMATQIDSNQANLTEQENIECIKESVENIDTSGDTINISDSFKTALVNTANYYASENEAYVYTFKQSEISTFPTGANHYTAIDKVVMLHSSPKGSIFEYYKDLQNRNYIGVLDLREHPYLVTVLRSNSSVNSNYPRYRDVLYYDGGTNTQITSWDYTYMYDNEEGEFLQVESNTMNNTAHNIFKTNNVSDLYSLSPMNMPNFSITVGALRFFNNASDITPNTILYQPYYYNNDVWQDFSTSNSGYTYSPSSINTVNYGDVTSYINSFNNENGYPPTIPEIEVNIKNEDTNNKDESGGDDSGGGSGSDDDDDNGSIFDWLKNLGKVLGDLIKGLGEFITEIIAGLVSALNDLMSSLSGLITDTLGSLTTVFSSIIDFVYAGLPDSVKGIMMLALTVSLLITVIQLIRK